MNVSRYRWAVDQVSGHALPTRRAFYDELFANGTAAGMVMFEQDFLCAINTVTTLTNTDLATGNAWVAAIDAAATDANITLQWCMMNGVHALATTWTSRVTNGRATRDNHPHQVQSPGINPGNAGNGLVLGVSGMLHHALGIWPSRDNVWTNSSVREHGGPEPMPVTQTRLAVLAGGPYGPSDGAGSANRSLILSSCRDDGVLLRADKPVTMLDSALRLSGFAPSQTPRAVNAWATYTQIGDLRWSYVLGLDLLAPVSVTPMDLGVVSPGAALLAWEHGGWPTSVTAVTAAAPLALPATGAPLDPATILASYYVLAPVLPNGWAFLGEPGKMWRFRAAGCPGWRPPMGGRCTLTAVWAILHRRTHSSSVLPRAHCAVLTPLIPRCHIHISPCFPTLRPKQRL